MKSIPANLFGTPALQYKDPLSGKRKKVERPKEEWVVQGKPEMRIISDETWNVAEKRWKEIENTFPTGKKKPGFSVQQKSRVKINPTHLLSGSLRCGCCEGSIALVSGKGSGYYGCSMHRVSHATIRC